MTSPNLRAFACTVALISAAPAAMGSQVFYENFRLCGFDPTPPCTPGPTAGGAGTYPFPAGWLLRNVDNRTPDPQVAYVNDAWEDREDFNFNVNEYAAFSTSYYSPVGQADDWMWTPAIAIPAAGATLTWRAVTYDPAYRDGYEVRVMTSPDVPTGGTGFIGNQVTNSTVVYSTPAENTAWTAHGLDLAAYAGQTVYIGFRNNSNDKFLLLIDDVAVTDTTPDAVAQASTPFASEYSRAPDGFKLDAMLGFTVFNGGGATLTNVTGTATAELGGSAAGLPFAGSSTPSLAIGASTPVTFAPGYQFIGPGSWAVRYIASSDQDASDLDTANNQIVVAGPAIGGNEFARTQGTASSTLGIGASNGGEIGAQFTLLADTTFEGIRFGMAAQPATIDDGMGGQIPNPWPGLPLIANLRSFDTSTPPGVPGALIDTTVPVAATLEGGSYDVAFAGGPHFLAAGTYVITVSEPVSAAAMTLPMHDNRFVPGTAWVNWPTSPLGGWANVEAFGSGFAKTPEVSLLTEMSIFKDGFEVPAPGLNGPAQVWHAQAPRLAPARPLRKPLATSLAQPR